MPTPLLKSTYSDIADTSIKTAGSEGNPFYDIHWLAKEDRKPNPKSYPYNKHGPYPPPKLWYLPNHRVTPFKHICIFSINWEMPQLKRTTRRTTKPSSRTALPMEPLAMLT